jgi:molybdopterin synthase catalytic subunit
MRANVHQKGSFSVDDLLKNVKSNSNFDKTGAIGLFIGVVRGEASEDKKVEKLTIESYEEKATEVLNKICDDLTKKPGIVDVQIHHLLGEFKPGEDLVYVAVSGSHRTGVFSVLEEAVERYKSEVPIFKKEHLIDKKGKKTEYWVSEQEGHKQ